MNCNIVGLISLLFAFSSIVTAGAQPDSVARKDSIARQDSATQPDSISKAVNAERLHRQIDELKRQKDSLLTVRLMTGKKPFPPGYSPDEIIHRFDSLTQMRCGRDDREKCGEPCLNQMAVLAALYWGKSRDTYIIEQEKYESDSVSYRFTSNSLTPVFLKKPIPDFSKSIELYTKIVELVMNSNASTEKKNCAHEACHQLNKIYGFLQNDSLAKYYGEVVIKKFPYEIPVVGFQQLGKLAPEKIHNENRQENQVELEKLQESDYSPRQWRMILFHHYFLAEDKTKAKRNFKNYVEQCYNGIYSWSDFCRETEEYFKVMEIHYSH
jgi:hypothetical protein